MSPKIVGIADASTPASQRPAILAGSRMIWIGTYDPNGVVQVGYPNNTNQVLYIDLESNRTPIASSTGTYSISMKLNCSLERNYDFVYFIGGGDSDGNPANGGDEDPLGNDRGTFDEVRATGAFGNATLQATLTGSITSTTPGVLAINGAAAPVIVGQGGADPTMVTTTLTMTTDNRALYILVTSDCLHSSEDGLWPFGSGVQLDDIVATSTGTGPRTMYAEQPAAGGTDPVGGDILVADPVTGTNPDGVRISARVFAGKGELWAVQDGASYPTAADFCAASKSVSSDRFFLGVDPISKNALPGQHNAVVSCTFAVPAGTADLRLMWGEYLNLERSSGYVQYAQYRYYAGGSWSGWRDTAASNTRHAGSINQWVTKSDHLTEATQADSVQMRWVIQCVPTEAADGVNCLNGTPYAVLYDDFLLEVTTGVPAPDFGVSVGALAQTTFVDGTMTGLNCATAPCWPGIRGSDLQTHPNVDVARSAVKDNFNAPLGDSIVVSIGSGLRKNGMGINWRFGFDRSVGGGLTIARTNGAFNPSFDVPRVIYRLFDPNSKSWSPWDSTGLDADAVSAAADTVVIGSAYRMNWPPRDKAGLNLPGGFTINGVGAYNSLAFLPRGARLQYYFKAVDINGGVTYQFTSEAPAYEVSDLPLLPGSAVRAPDILEFQVLPGAYAAGTVGSLVQGRTDTPVLNLDGAYTAWSFQVDPVTQALRGMGVRADRYRHLQAHVQGANAGGHELAGDRPLRLSNYFPNKDEYGIVDSLRAWYRIIIQSSHLRTPSVFDESDAELVYQWAATPTNSNDGDRCIFLSGDDGFHALLNQPVGVPGARQQALANLVFGVANVTPQNGGGEGAWVGTTTHPYPAIDDRFAASSAGPGLAAPGSFTYEVDGGCPGANRFDPLTPTGGAFASATFPLAGGFVDNASVANSKEFDTPSDLDRVKSLGYGFSIQFVRGAAGVFPKNAANYVHSGVENRMRILYKFLTGCRGGRASGSLCWPCPTDPAMLSNWATAGGFNTATYGPLYPIQDIAHATGIDEPAPGAVPRVNALGQNRPNPFNPATTIPFSTAAAGRVTIRVFDVAGRLVRTLVDRTMPSGDYAAQWNGETESGGRAASGAYFYRIVFPGGEISNKKMIILR